MMAGQGIDAGAPPGSDGERFVLRATLTSPYGRKVRMAARVLNLEGRIRVEPADTRDAGDSLRTQNPLGKMPCLLRADGTAVYDSRVIVEFLQEVAGSQALLAPRGEARYRALTLATLADGIMDAALLVVYEDRYRPTQAPVESWLDLQRGKILRALAAFDERPPDAGVTDLVTITLACALGYLDWRRPVAWRAQHPALEAWLERFAQRESAFAATAAPAWA